MDDVEHSGFDPTFDGGNSEAVPCDYWSDQKHTQRSEIVAQGKAAV